MYKWIMAYADLCNGTTELIVISADSSENAMHKGLQSKGWETENLDSIYDCTWSEPVRLDLI